MSAMKKNTLRHLSRIMAAVLLASLVLSLWGTAVSSGDGTLTVKIGSGNNILPKDDIRISIYQIGLEDNTSPSYWRISDIFSGIKIVEAKTSAEIDAAANQVAAILHSRNSSARASGTPNGDGVIRFTGLEHGVYYGEVSRGPEGLAAQNFIVTIPDLNIQPVSYDATVVMKYSFVPTPTPTPEPTPEPTPSPTPTPTPEAPPPPPNVTATPTVTPDWFNPTPSPVVTNTPEPTMPPHPYTLTIYYIYEDGSQAWETYQEVLWPGTEYDVVSPVIPGYRATILEVQGVMPHHDMEYVVIYIPKQAGKNYINMDDYETALGLGDIQIHVGVCFE